MTTTTPTTTVTQPSPATISDTFESNQIDGTIWYQIHQGDGWTISPHNGHLEFAFLPGTTPGPPYGLYGGHVGTLCKFPGDFDARVDYTLSAWPAGNGIRVGLWSFFSPNNDGWQVWRQSTAQAGEQYGSFTGPGVSGSVSLDDATGTLRLARHNGIVTTYFLHNSKWVSLTSGRNTSYATIAVGAQATAPNQTFGSDPVVIDFDNFQVAAVNPACPPGSRPS